MNELRIPALRSLESYDCPELILKFARDHQVTMEEAQLVFKETLKMLWLMVKHQLAREAGPNPSIPEAFNVHKPMMALDEMWHEFILFTREYHQFCLEYFGCYLHHIPCSEKEYQAFKQRALEQKEEFIARERLSIGIFVKYVQENLGTHTLKTWFMGLPEVS